MKPLWKFNGSAVVESQLCKSFCSYPCLLCLLCLPSPAVSVLCPRKMARLLQRHDCCWTSVQHIVPRGLWQSCVIGCELVSERDLASVLTRLTKYPSCNFGFFFSSAILFMLASTGSLLLDECNIACSLNYGALTRGISEDVDKMNIVPQLLLLMNCGKCSNLHGRRYDMSYSCFRFNNTSPTPLEMFIIVINILSGSGDLSDTRHWKGLIKRSYCDRRREIQHSD